MNEIINCLLERRSIREFRDIPIEKAHLDEILKCGIASPNGNNKQTWKFTVLQVRDNIISFKRNIVRTLEITHTDSLHGFGDPTAIIIVTDRKCNYNAMANGACAIMNMMSAAWSLGIGTCWVNALRTIQEEEDIRKMLTDFQIPEDHMVVGMIVMGYMLEEKIPKKPHRRTDVIYFAD